MLRDLKLQPCISCGNCHKKGVCIFQDDMWSIYEDLQKSTALVIASPIYFASITAQLKAFIDRAQPFWARKYLLQEENMPITDQAFFIAAGAIDTDKYFKNAQLVIKTLLMNLDIPYTGDFFLSGVDCKGEVFEKSGVLEKVEEKGSQFIQSM